MLAVTLTLTLEYEKTFSNNVNQKYHSRWQANFQMNRIEVGNYPPK